MDSKILIKSFNELLLPSLDKNITIKQFTTKSLTAPGENYGSLILKVEVEVQENGTNKEDTLHLVAKMCPPNEWIKKMFNIPVSFKKEIAVYKTIMPTLKSFQQQHGVPNVISYFPECYGARISLDPKSNTVDDDAVLLLENLISTGYEVVDRMKGFNLETTELIIKDLATFHAIPIAIKLLKPDLFNKNILPYLDRVRSFDCISEDAEQAMFDTVLNTAKLNQECIPHIENVEKALKLGLNLMKNRPAPREPFATINHNDYWVNNTMLKFINGKPVHNKIVDFQLIDYGSPANDLLFFLFSSVQKQVLDLYYDNLIKLYYDAFIMTLNDLRCNTDPFTFELFLKEIDDVATIQFFHVMVMLRPIFMKKDKAKELSELTEMDLMTEDTLSDEYRQKVPETVFHFIKKKWV